MRGFGPDVTQLGQPFAKGLGLLQLEHVENVSEWILSQDRWKASDGLNIHSQSLIAEAFAIVTDRPRG